MRINGLFVVLEGLDGAGKTTQAVLLAEHLRNDGYTVVHTREPGGSALAENIRTAILRTESPSPYSNRTAALLMNACRSDHVERIIKPSLKAKKIVVCDRYTLSTLAYQGFEGSVVGREELDEINSFAIDGIYPDLTIFLDIEPDIAIERLKTRSNYSDLFYSKKQRMSKIYDEYKNCMGWETNNVYTIDAELPVKTITKRMVARVEQRIAKSFGHAHLIKRGA